MTATTAPSSTRFAVLLPFAIVTLVWGSTWLVIRDQVSSVPPSWSVCYRFLVGGTGMVLLALVRRESFALDARGWRFAGLIALSQFCLNFNFVYRAEEHITSGIVAVVFALMLVPNAVLARVFLGQRMGAQLLLGSAVAMAGIALLFLHEVRLNPRGPGEAVLGIGLTALAILSASTSNVLQATDTARRYPMVPTLAVAMLLGAALDGAIALVLSGPPVIEWRPAYIGGIVYLGLIGSTLTFPLYFGVVRAIGPAKAAYSGVIVPVIAMLLSTLFEGYRWTGLAVAGAALAGAGLVIALRARRPAR
ncbi:EamA family transporter [Sphingomonas sp. AR_OL41]|uniref:DMT family transporter n=1 Tax=Sphingomonas sp. AR_OL41 TaxID=3042729 RepID=UPI0024817422|nr:EamA family transporter [Sphingomonas sp. AR_OL41]MDH7972144.1 EamA family transporter [Sphingomonas sp. AR_OL41]